MRTPRTEIVSVDTKRLAAHAFSRLGLVCIRAAPVDDKSTRLAIDTIATPGGFEYWFPKVRDATDVLDQVVLLEGMPWTASCIDGAVLVEAPVGAIDDVIGEAMRWASRIPRLISRAAVADQMANIQRDVERSLVELQVARALKTLNSQYKALRTSRATGLPSFKVWMTAQLESLILLKLAERAAA